MYIYIYEYIICMFINKMAYSLRGVPQALWIQGFKAEMLEEEEDFDAAFLVKIGSSKDHQTI